MTFSVTTGSSIGVSAIQATATNDTQTLDSYVTRQTLLDTSASGSSADDGSVALVIGGEATAIGQNTLAVGSMTADIDGTGSVTTVSGNAAFGAVATATGDELAFATAGSYAVVSGIDYSVVIGSSSEIVHQEPGASLWLATSETTIYGVDLDPDNLGAITDTSLTEPGPSSLDDVDLLLADEPGASLDPSVLIDGNAAIMDVVANVSGENTLLGVEISVLTVEDTLSTVNAQVVVAAD